MDQGEGTIAYVDTLSLIAYKILLGLWTINAYGELQLTLGISDPSPAI